MLIIRYVACIAGIFISTASLSFSQANPSVRLLNQGKVDELIASLHGKDDAASHNLKGRAYYAEEATDQAIKEGEKSVASAPQNSNYHLWLGRFYGQKAEKASAFRAAGLAGKVRDQFEKAVQLDPNNLQARSDLAEYDLDAPGFMGGGTDKASAQADAIAAKDPAMAHWLRARLAEKAKNWPEAEKQYKAAIDSGGGKGEQWLNLAAFYKARGRSQEMMSALNKAIASSHKSAAVLYDAADLLFHANQNFNTAAGQLRKYIGSADTIEDAPVFKAHFLLGQIFEKQGDKPSAIKEYQSALSLAKGYSPAGEALRKLK